MNGIAEARDGLARYLVSQLRIGETYSLDTLAKLIGVQTNALRGKGVITRTNSDFQFLLITIQKDKYATQEYIDHIEGSTLFWSGQNALKSAEKKIISGTCDTMIFIQEKRKTPYVYYGRAIPTRMHIIWEPGTPSHIVFELVEYAELCRRRELVETENFITKEGIEITVERKTEEDRVISIRTAQSLYRNNSLSFWHNKCAVTGVDEPDWLIASHIKPWRESTNTERIDPHNSLLLTPNYDKLFDRGIISFSPHTGKIILPENQSRQMWENFNKLHINSDIKLRELPSGVGKYLEYHNNYVYNFTPNDDLPTDEFVDSLLLSGRA